MTKSQIVILHIPHSSSHVPAEERQTIRLDDKALNDELLKLTDAHTDELFPPTTVEAGRVIFPVSRLVCDVERFPSDADESMATQGMGAIYTRTSKCEVLRAQPNGAKRQSLLDCWYWPHHQKLERMSKDIAARSGVCLIVDCHSFSSVALPHERDQTKPRPDFCIGTDSFHTPAAVRDALIATIENENFSVAVNAPFAGALVPLSSYRRDCRILSVMIEVNRRLYMDEHSGVKGQSFGKIRSTLGRLIVMAAETAAGEAPTCAGPPG